MVPVEEKDEYGCQGIEIPAARVRHPYGRARLYVFVSMGEIYGQSPLQIADPGEGRIPRFHESVNSAARIPRSQLFVSSSFA